MTTSMHMWIGVCLCSGRESVADPSVLHMASIVVKMLDNQPLLGRSPRVSLLEEKLLFSLFIKTPVGDLTDCRHTHRGSLILSRINLELCRFKQTFVWWPQMICIQELGAIIKAQTDRKLFILNSTVIQNIWVKSYLSLPSLSDSIIVH